MIIVDSKLAERAKDRNPLKVGIFGAGAMSRGFVNQIIRYTPGMKVAAVCNRTISKARDMLRASGVPDDQMVEAATADAIDRIIEAGKIALVEDPIAMTKSGRLEVGIEATGHVEYGAKITVAAIDNGLPLVLMNAEMDSTIGPLLYDRARKAGVIITGCDGDQPGVEMNLHRFVESIGLKPLICGNIKGLQDHYRTPATQAAFAKEWDQSVHMVTSFADGTKVSFEQAIVANATGMKVAKRGMLGIEHRGHIDEMVDMYDIDQVRELGGIVEYALGTAPGPGVYVFAEAQDDIQKHYLKYGKLGDGPIYSFYVPYHLMVFEVPLSAARVGLLNDTVIASKAGPEVDVIAIAKTDLKAGQTLDGIGGFYAYGVCENYETVRSDNLLPMGISEGCILKNDVRKDAAISYDDVILPKDSLAVKLRQEQDKMFPITR
ncbi:NAD(P)H-dependent oxidoreductase [Hirschia litorea]|uniref:NAD(P)H-dependent oxidoreductase n=1 Tax=Hirschia litorea TaxID=1199156 RepID=A0ABW2IG06_9PROT